MPRKFLTFLLILSILAPIISGTSPFVVPKAVEQCCCSMSHKASETNGFSLDKAHCKCHINEQSIPVQNDSTLSVSPIEVHIYVSFSLMPRITFDFPQHNLKEVIHCDTGPPGLYPNRAIYLQTNRFLC